MSAAAFVYVSLSVSVSMYVSCLCLCMCLCISQRRFFLVVQYCTRHLAMGRLRSAGSIKLQVYFAEYPLFYRALLQKRHIILSILLIEATHNQGEEEESRGATSDSQKWAERKQKREGMRGGGAGEGVVFLLTEKKQKLRETWGEIQNCGRESVRACSEEREQK